MNFFVTIFEAVICKTPDPHFNRKCRKGVKLLLKLAVVVGVGWPLWLIIRGGLAFLCNLDLDKQSLSPLIKVTGMLVNRSAMIAICVLIFRRELRVLLKWLGTPAKWLKSLLLPLIVSLVLNFLSCIVPPTILYWFSSYGIHTGGMTGCGPQGGVLLQLLSGLFGFTVTPIFEEILFRGVLFIVLLRLFGKWPAILLCVVAFTSLHPHLSRWFNILDVSAAAGGAFFVLFKT